LIITYRDQIRKTLKRYVEDNVKFVIYPFGEKGKLVKEVLNDEFNQKETYIVDNFYKGDVPVINSDMLLSHLSKDMVVLLCCENAKAKKQIWKTLSLVSGVEITDVFPPNILYIANWEQKTIEESMIKDLEKIFSGLRDLVFKDEKRIYKILEEYKNIALSEQFEIFLCKTVKNKALQRAYSLLLAVLLKELQLNENELLVGKASYRLVNSTYPMNIYEEIYQLGKEGKIAEEEKRLIQDAYEMRLFTRFPGGHVVPGYENILNYGIGKYLTYLKEKLNHADKDKNIFYQAELIVLKSLQELIKRYSDFAKVIAAQKDNRILQEISRNCDVIAYEKPVNFKQACQLLWLSHEVMILEGNIKGISMGRMDQYLYPFYKEDLKRGILDREEAYVLACSLWKKFSFDRKALAFQNVTLGGLVDEEQDGCNELTILFMDAQLATRENQPMLSLRVNKYTPHHVWEKALNMISTGMGVPALFNDDVVMQAKRYAGVQKKDAINYSIVGCVEPTVGGKEYSQTEGLRINVAKVLELILFNGICPVTGRRYSFLKERELDSFLNFEDFYIYFKGELKVLINRACHLLKCADISYGKNWPAPYLSLFMDRCLEKGRDIADGGTKYHNLCINFAGMANVVDSLIAIKEIIYEKRMVSLTKVPQMMEHEFAGSESVRFALLDIPHYGNNQKEVDDLMKDLTEFIIDVLNRNRTNTGGFQAGFYSVWLHAEMGKYMTASLDGRSKGAALASSLSPVQGTDKKGPLAVFHSVTKTPMNKMSNGMVLDLKFTPDFFKSASKREKIKMAVLEYFTMGGMEVQINVTDHDTLIQAQRHPENFRNLLVRVSGFSTYFVELEKVIQDEIILRYANESI